MSLLFNEHLVGEGQEVRVSQPLPRTVQRRPLIPPAVTAAVAVTVAISVRLLEVPLVKARIVQKTFTMYHRVPGRLIFDRYEFNSTAAGATEDTQHESLGSTARDHCVVQSYLLLSYHYNVIIVWCSG